MRRNKDESAEIPLSSLIDVVFLLIIFFIVTANLEQEVVDLQIKLADSYFVEPPKEVDPRTLTINIRNVPGQEPVFSIGGMGLKVNDIKPRLFQMSQKHGTDAPIVIRASRELEYRYVDQINKLVTDVGLYRVQHATRAQKE
jgi:biopolymer transport protein ExbD